MSPDLALLWAQDQQQRGRISGFTEEFIPELCKLVNENRPATAPAPRQESGETGRRSYGPATDDTVMPFGKHRGTKLKDVPKAYWEWWLSQSPKEGGIKDYATRRLKGEGTFKPAPAQEELPGTKEDDGDDIPF